MEPLFEVIKIFPEGVSAIEVNEAKLPVFVGLQFFPESFEIQISPLLPSINPR
jgi:hypothetical protein